MQHINFSLFSLSLIYVPSRSTTFSYFDWVGHVSPIHFQAFLGSSCIFPFLEKLQDQFDKYYSPTL